jgi:branched-chain amino acid transport system ATP-binding protein
MTDSTASVSVGPPAGSMAPLLEATQLTSGYDGVSVIFDISLTVGRGETVLVVGSNGAGKTTTLRSIMGLLPRHGGTVRYAGKELSPGRPWRRAGSGMALIPAERFTFADLSIDENLELGAYSVSDGKLKAERRDGVFEMFPRLAERRSQKAGTMSGGEQRMLSVGVAMMSGPDLLLLDEPSLGLAPVVVEEIMQTINGLVTAGDLSVIMVEQNIGQALKIADRVYVIRSGRIILEQTAEAMRAREDWWELF